MVVFAPGDGVVARFQPAQAIFQPLLRWRAVGQGAYFRTGQRVGAVGHAPQATPCQRYLRGGQQALKRHLHWQLPFAQRLGDPFHMVVGARQHGDVAVARLAFFAGRRVDDELAIGHQSGDAVDDQPGAFGDIVRA